MGLGGGRNTTTEATRLVGMQLQSSDYGRPLPLLYGTTRVAAKLIDYDDFTAIQHTDTQKTGKGGGGSTSTSITYTYTAGGIMALCEGPIQGVNQIWMDKAVSSLDDLGWTLYTGTRPQAPWPTWAQKHPDKSVGYSGFAYCCDAAMDLGDSGSLPNTSFEVIGLLADQAVAGSTIAFDARPDAVLSDFIQNPYYGASPGFPLADLWTGSSSYRTYCQAAGFQISPLFDEQQDAAKHLQDILDATNSEAVWSSGPNGMLLKIIPYGDTPITANGASYLPNTTPLYDLNYDDFLGVVDDTGAPTGDDPITVTRSSTQDVRNCVPVEFWDRGNAYNNSVVEPQETADVIINGLKTDSALTLHMITSADHATQISVIRSQRSVYVRNTYTFKLGWRYLLLEPMDLVTLTDPKLGLDHQIVRIITVEIPEETSEADGLTITAEEWPFGAGTGTKYASQGNGGHMPDVGADPGPANAPVILDVPALYSQSGGPEILIGASGGDIWGGADVWVSADNATYAFAGNIPGRARHGTLMAPLAIGQDVQDAISQAQVDLGVSRGELQSVAPQVATDLQSLCWCDGEMLAYQTAVLTGPYQYTLKDLLVRGAYGTVQRAHPAGSPFVRVDPFLCRVSVPPSRIGQTIWIKLASYNIWGGGRQSLAEVSPIEYTPGAQQFPSPYGVSITVVPDTRI